MIEVIIPKDMYVLTINGFVQVQDLEPVHIIKTFELSKFHVFDEEIMRPSPYYGHLLNVEDIGRQNEYLQLDVYHGSLKLKRNTEILTEYNKFKMVQELNKDTLIYMVIRGHMLVDTYIHKMHQLDDSVESVIIKADCPSLLVSYDDKGSITAIIK